MSASAVRRTKALGLGRSLGEPTGKKVSKDEHGINNREMENQGMWPNHAQKIICFKRITTTPKLKHAPLHLEIAWKYLLAA